MTTDIITTQVDEPIVEVRDRLLSWLDSTEWTTGEAAEWCLGYSLPAIGHEERPFVWILRGLPAPHRRRPYEQELARRLADLLAQFPGRGGDRREKEELLYNLFKVCAGIAGRDELAVPLFDALRRFAEVGNHNGIGTLARVAFCDALIRNQVDDRLLAVWKRMLKGEKDALLPSDPYTGFHGVRLMPASQETRGAPALDAIGMALRCMAEHLEPLEDRLPRFRELIQIAIRTYPDHPMWDVQLIDEADQHQWPLWAVDCLPSHFVQTPEGQWYISKNLARMLGFSEEDAIRTLCCGAIGVFEFRPEALNDDITTATIIRGMEEARKNVPFATSRAIVGAINQSLIEFEIESPPVVPLFAGETQPKSSEVREEIESKRKILLKCVPVGV